MGTLTGWAGWLSAHREGVVLAAGAATVLLLVVAGVVRHARRGRPDRWVDGVALVLTLAWSAEGMWEVSTGTLDLGAAFAVPALFVFTSLMASAMLRAQRHQRVHGNPGKHGRFAWAVAVAEACVVSLAGDTATEGALRIAIPLLAVGQWWLGMTADGTTEELGRTSWRWTPRRLLLAVGAIEPGERDAVTLDRDRLIARMTRIEHQRRHATKKTARRHERRLARLSLTADDDVIAEVRQRVDRATWWQHPAELDTATQDTAEQAVTALRAGLARARTWVDTRQHATTAQPTGPGTGQDTGSGTSAGLPADAGTNPAVPAGVVAASSVRVPPARRVQTRSESAQKVARAAAKLPAGTPAQIAAKAGVSERTARRYLPTPPPAPTDTAPAETPNKTTAIGESMEVAA
ncbi:hypothetical protein [Pilimelia columellifera]|uniref:DUF2637 domain-containing protein n=1 Tax=Pilimelia columellifera subsp. columellifera TaxID=706583 RepID=A0ABN3NAP6_9ACTN